MELSQALPVYFVPRSFGDEEPVRFLARVYSHSIVAGGFELMS